MTLRLLTARRRRREEAAEHQAAVHRGKQLTVAADWAITTGWIDLPLELGGDRLVVSVSDVQRRAVDDFNLAVDPDLAAAALRQRLEARAFAALAITDAYEEAHR